MRKAPDGDGQLVVVGHTAAEAGLVLTGIGRFDRGKATIDAAADGLVEGRPMFQAVAPP